jgi:hypothetical protein
MSPLTHALIQYWQRLPAESPAARRRALETACDHVARGMEPHGTLLPFVLGDTDEELVATATRACVDARGARGPAGGAVPPAAVDEAVEWVRRGLALNRGAVFGALLSAGGEATLERLPALRLGLSPSEVETACRVLGPAPSERVVGFLVEWLALLADGPHGAEQRALTAVLQGRDRAEAA